MKSFVPKFAPTPQGELRRRARVLASMASQCPGEILLRDEPALQEVAGDKWFARNLPQAVGRPRTAEETSLLLRLAYENNLPVTPRGAGIGYVGGCVPAQGGLVLDVSGMNRIREIHAGDFVAVVEPGVKTAKLQERAARRGLFYPPDPASRADCSLGGNIATNAGGPRCLKYGVTRDYVLGLQVVLPQGEIVRLGGRTHKNKTGFDLHRLFVGSEGMLGVVTEATLKLLPLPPYRGALSIGFRSLKAATDMLDAVFAAGFLPSALEIADAFTLAAAEKRTGNASLAGCKAHLIIELDGQPDGTRDDLSKLARLASPLDPVFLDRADGEEACESIWRLRREFSYSLRDTGLTKLNEDITVPRSKLRPLFRLANRIQKKHGLAVACFGHAGDGNIHVNVMVDESQPGSDAQRDAALDELFTEILSWGGVVTGEHGIGLAKKPWWNMAVSPESQDLHQVIKRALDPKGLLNPGKFLG